MALFDAGLSIFGIRLYALCILLGIIVGVYMMIKEGKRLGIYSPNLFGSIINVGVVQKTTSTFFIIFNKINTLIKIPDIM